MTDTAGEESDSSFVKPVYVYRGPKWLADLKLRFGRWLETRGWAW